MSETSVDCDEESPSKIAALANGNPGAQRFVAELCMRGFKVGIEIKLALPAKQIAARRTEPTPKTLQKTSIAANRRMVPR